MDFSSINFSSSSYMFNGNLSNFLEPSDRIFISTRGIYINRGGSQIVTQNDIGKTLTKLETLINSEETNISFDVKPFFIFSKDFDSNSSTKVEVLLPDEMIHIDPNNRVTHFIISKAESDTEQITNDILLYPHSIEIISEESREDFCDKVEQATKKIANSDLEKVVIARQINMRSDVNFDTRLVVAQLIDSQPQSYIYSINNFVGASPELLVEKFSRTISLLPMAGTRKRHARTSDDDVDVSDLQTNSKDLAEHAFLVDNILSKLSTVAYDIAASPTPKVLRLPHVSHLTTPISATLFKHVDLLQLVNLLHPTPAVGGTPLDLALDTIDELENFDREIYGAPVGWIDSEGNGQCAIAIRCAKIVGNVATLFAGVGIVLESNAESEFDESQAKFGPMRDALLNIVR